MIKKLLNKEHSSSWVAILVAVSLLQGSYQSPYKYGNIDLLSIPIDTAVECLVDPPDAKFPIMNPASHIVLHTSRIPFTVTQEIQQYILRINSRNLTYTILSPEIPAVNPLISILQKNHSPHSSQDDDVPSATHC